MKGIWGSETILGAKNGVGTEGPCEGDPGCSWKGLARKQQVAEGSVMSTWNSHGSACLGTQLRMGVGLQTTMRTFHLHCHRTEGNGCREGH